MLPAEAGADAVKFQTFKSEKLVTKKAQKAAYQKRNTNETGSQFEMLKKLELSFEAFKELKKYCEQKNVDFLSTPFDEESAHFLKEMGVDAFKIGSGDLTNLPFLKVLSTLQLPIILSSGMATIKEIEEALEALDNCNVAILHCTSCYPAPVEEVNLKAIQTIQQAFGRVVGYSDHTDGVEISVAAITLGAKIIEKHFTLDRNLPGPDHKASLEPNEFQTLVSSIRNVENAMGDGIKKCMPSELNTRQVARKSLVILKDIQEGEVLTEESLGVKRPGDGIEPKFYELFLGKKVNKTLFEDHVLKWEDVL